MCNVETKAFDIKNYARVTTEIDNILGLDYEVDLADEKNSDFFIVTIFDVEPQEVTIIAAIENRYFAKEL